MRGIKIRLALNEPDLDQWGYLAEAKDLPPRGGYVTIAEIQAQEGDRVLWGVERGCGVDGHLWIAFVAPAVEPTTVSIQPCVTKVSGAVEVRGAGPLQVMLKKVMRWPTGPRSAGERLQLRRRPDECGERPGDQRPGREGKGPGRTGQRGH